VKILWVTNIPIAKHNEITKSSPNNGGWMLASLEMLKENKAIDLCIATIWPIKEKASIKDMNIEYVVLPSKNPMKYNPYKKSNIEDWKFLMSKIQPDIIHIHGTEFAHGLALMSACPDKKYVISIQGICSIIERYYYAGIDFSAILKNLTIRDLLRQDTIFHAKRQFRLKGIIEKKYLNMTNHVIGRTTWDFIHTKTINSNLNYHFCNESLRSEFYNKNWDLTKIKRHSIFVSQASYPVKGLHVLLKALNIIKKKYSNIIINIAGDNILKSDNLISKLKRSGYANYLQKIINEYSLSKHLNFIGNINAEQMALLYQYSHVFICPSSIENSPNSLGEAQLVGTPCIASYVGGIPDMIQNEETGLLYRFEEFEMLANNINRIFENDELAIFLSANSKKVALKRHNRSTNLNTLISIYKQIIYLT